MSKCEHFGKLLQNTCMISYNNSEETEQKELQETDRFWTIIQRRETKIWLIERGGESERERDAGKERKKS